MKLRTLAAWIRLRWKLREAYRNSLFAPVVTYDEWDSNGKRDYPWDRLDELNFALSRYYNPRQVFCWGPYTNRQLQASIRTWRMAAAPKGNLP